VVRDNNVRIRTLIFPQERTTSARPVIGRSALWTWLVAAALGMALAGAACGGDCPPIPRVDHFPLDVLLDASAPSDAAPDAGHPDGGAAPDAGGPHVRLNCGSLAEGCTPGQACPPACDCVLARQRMGMDPKTIIDGCILAAGPGPPSVEVRSRLVVDCE
jgi:hypothetical protein